MELRWAIFAGILFLNALLATIIAYLLREKRRAPGGKEMLAVFVGLGIWTFTYGMITLWPTMEGKIFWLRVENIGIAGVPLLWFLFAVRYTRRDKWLKWPLMALLLVIPVVSLTLIFSDRWFHLFYASVTPVAGDSGPLKIERGFWYFFSLVQNYTLIATGAGLLFWHYIQFGRSYRPQLITLMVAIAVPWLVNTFYQVGGRLFPVIAIPIDLTPISFTITALMISLSVLGLKLFDLIPIARSTVLENIPEMVFVLDTQNRIVDANPAACMWMGKTRHEIIGQGAASVFSEWPELQQRYQNITDVREEIEIPGEPPRTLDVTISGIYNRINALEGRVIVARDITMHKMMEMELLEANHLLSQQVVEVSALKEQLQEQAIRDPLTGLFNRRFLAETLDREIPKAARDLTPVSIAIMDVDHFKVFNDRYGHKCGDLVLQALADTLVEHSRRSDVVCRYGGEEFVVLMPGATLEIARERAESWRRLFETYTVRYNDQNLRATFSVGVACYPEHATDSESLLQAADAAMYQSKVNGRNQLTVFEPGHHIIS